jgi:threonine/homoserine/homoserine lactone efflux protein
VELDTRFGAFVLLSVLLIVTPGPDTALIIRNALAGGPRASAFSAVGVAFGILAWAVAATLGVGVLLERSSVAFTILKLAGAAYLCYLGVRSLLRSPRDTNPVGALPVRRTALSDREALRQGLLSNLLNPKTGAFFVTVMPQFLVAGDSPLRLLLMVAAFESMLLVWLTGYGHVISRLGASGPGVRVRQAMSRITGLVLIGLGARLALDHTASD